MEIFEIDIKETETSELRRIYNETSESIIDLITVEDKYGIMFGDMIQNMCNKKMQILKEILDRKHKKKEEMTEEI